MQEGTNRILRLTLGAILPLIIAQATLAQTTQFTYQGKLSDGGTPANGSYDLQFKLFDTATVGTGTQQGATVTPPTVTVTSGIFTVSLDFGVCASCFNGSPRFLEIAAKPAASGSFTTLTPRQPVTSNPYAIKSLSAATADGLSVACVNCVTSAQINSVSGSQVTGLIPVTSVPDLSLSYVQNKTSPPQVGANFNIDGNGNVGGTLTGNVVNSATQYNIAGNRLFGIGGTNNFFAGLNAGFSNTTGGDNLFVGQQAGEANTSGSFNSFFGTAAGVGNTTGGSNAFVGNSSGFANTTGNNNTIIGTFANVGASNLNFATALGAGAVVSSNNTVTLGRTADTVQIPGLLNVTGSTTFAGTLGANTINAATGYYIGGNRVLSSIEFFNLFAGINAGVANTTGAGNSFFGYEAGQFNTSGSSNSFFGFNAGKFNTSGHSNSFFGGGAGTSNTTGNFNSFLGAGAGGANTTGRGNSFFGVDAGRSNKTAILNVFVGQNAGQFNTSGSSNTFLGTDSGLSNTIEDDNTFVGSQANGLPGITNATSIGFQASVTQSDSVVLGSNVNVGIGTTAPQYKLHIVGQDLRVESGGPTSFPRFSLNFTGGAVDEKRWQNYASPGALNFSALNDAENAETRWLRVNRGPGAAVSTVVFENGIVALNNLGAAGATALCHNASNQISTCSSSIRYKQNIQAFYPGLSLIQQLRPVSFNWRANNQADFGLVAEDVAKIDPLLTTSNDKGEIEGVKYDRLGVVLVNAVQEQQRQIESLEKRNQSQQEQLDEQKRFIKRQQELVQEQQTELEALKSLVCSQNRSAKTCKPRR